MSGAVAAQKEVALWVERRAGEAEAAKAGASGLGIILLRDRREAS